MRQVCDGYDIDVLLPTGETRVLHLSSLTPPSKSDVASMVSSFKAACAAEAKLVVEPPVDYQAKYSDLQARVATALAVDVKSLDAKLTQLTAVKKLA
jgi:hypothetical protein